MPFYDKLLTHARMQRIISAELLRHGWQVGLEVPFSAFGKRYLFDVVGVKDGEVRIVEVKKWLNPYRDFLQLYKYLYVAARTWEKSQVFLATDEVNEPLLRQKPYRPQLRAYADLLGLRVVLVSPVRIIKYAPPAKNLRHALAKDSSWHTTASSSDLVLQG